MHGAKKFLEVNSILDILVIIVWTMTMIVLLITMNIVMSARMEEEVCATTLALDRSLVSPRPPHMPGIGSRVSFPN